MKSPHPRSREVPRPEFYYELPSSKLKLVYTTLKNGLIKCGTYEGCSREQILDLLATLSFDEDNDQVMITIVTQTNKHYHVGSTVTNHKSEPEEDL